MSWKIGTGLTALLGVLILSAQASAQECKADSDCPKTYACQVTGGSGCAGGTSAGATPAPNCKPGADCPVVVVDAGAPPDCQAQEYKSCVPGPCKADTDCSDGMICQSETHSVCSGGTAAPCTQQNCPAPTKETCTDETTSLCIPRYLAPCTAAADCGDGFDCVLEQSHCACANGSGSSPSDPGSGGGQAKALPLPPPDAGAGDFAAPVDAGSPPACDCPVATTKSCVAKTIACDDAAQCPKAWTCEHPNIADTGCAVAPAKPGTDAGPADCAPAANPAPTPTQGQCLPPFSSLGFGTAQDSSNATGGGTAGADKGSTDGSAAPTAAHTTDDTASNTKKSSTCSVARVGSNVDPTGHIALAFGVLGMLVTWRARRRSARTAR